MLDGEGLFGVRLDGGGLLGVRLDGGGLLGVRLDEGDESGGLRRSIFFISLHSSWPGRAVIEKITPGD
jgi:hypothetical protein